MMPIRVESLIFHTAEPDILAILENELITATEATALKRERVSAIKPDRNENAALIREIYNKSQTASQFQFFSTLKA